MAQDHKATVRAVAELAGVDKMTVTRALRGDAHVSEKTRAKVQQAAEALGYRPNPAAGAVMSQVRRGRVADYRGKIAWLDPGYLPIDITPHPWNRPLHDGIRWRAEQSGYILEDIWINEPHLQFDHLTSILIARGIQGLIVPDPHPALDFIDWNRFACANTMRLPLAPPMHMAATDLVHGMREALVHLRRNGYNRIGLMLHSIHDQGGKSIERAIYLVETAEFPARSRLPILVLPNPSDRPALIAAFGNWVRQYQPDAVICCDENMLDWAHTLGIKVPDELGLVHLNRHPYLTQWAGIDQHEDQIGAAAVDLVVGQLTRGESGLPRFPKQVLIKGEWVDGATLRL